MATVYQDLPVGGASFKSTNFAVFTVNPGTNFPVPVLKFSTATDAFWSFRAYNYGSGNLTVTVDWYADSATSGDVVWSAAIAAITPDVDTTDVETKAFATAAASADTHLGTTGQREHRAPVTVSALDSLAADDRVRLRLSRNATGNTMAGAAFVTGITVSYSDT
jgi:hypothetical protein